MFSRFLGWFLSMTLAFFAGANIGSKAPADSELKEKVQGHMDVIVDESAAIVDDITEELRGREQEVEEAISEAVSEQEEEFRDVLETVPEEEKVTE